MSKAPEFYQKAKQQYPEVFGHYEALSQAVKGAGPLSPQMVALVKLGISMGSGLEGATHSGVRKALAAGCSPDEIRHVALLGVTTLGFPAMMRARAWVEDVLKG